MKTIVLNLVLIAILCGCKNKYSESSQTHFLDKNSHISVNSNQKLSVKKEQDVKIDPGRFHAPIKDSTYGCPIIMEINSKSNAIPFGEMIYTSDSCIFSITESALKRNYNYHKYTQLEKYYLLLKNLEKKHIAVKTEITNEEESIVKTINSHPSGKREQSYLNCEIDKITIRISDSSFKLMNPNYYFFYQLFKINNDIVAIYSNSDYFILTNWRINPAQPENLKFEGLANKLAIQSIEEFVIFESIVQLDSNILLLKGELPEIYYDDSPQLVSSHAWLGIYQLPNSISFISMSEELKPRKQFGKFFEGAGSEAKIELLTDSLLVLNSYVSHHEGGYPKAAKDENAIEEEFDGEYKPKVIVNNRTDTFLLEDIRKLSRLVFE